MSRIAIGCFATEGYYVDHLASIWLALRKKRRGPFFVTKRARESAIILGIPESSVVLVPKGNRKTIIQFLKSHPFKGALLSASLANWRIVTDAGLRNPTLPHGQGGPGPGNSKWVDNSSRLDLMLVPSPYAIIPKLNCQVIHGQPKLDRWFGYRPANEKPVLALSFRWREEQSAWEHYLPHLAQIKADADAAGIELLGHGHPLRFAEFEKEWTRLGIESSPSLEYVLSVADLYAADCSSSSFEFVGLDRPILFLWTPSYEGATKAPRFTQQTAGLTNYNPVQLIPDALRALEDPPELSEARSQVKNLMFRDFTGAASENAARILENFYA